MSQQSPASGMVWVQFSLRHQCHTQKDTEYYCKKPPDTYSALKGIPFLGWLQRTEIKPKDWASQLLPEIQMSQKGPDQKQKEVYLKP